MEKELYIATNNGDIGGGEVMLLNIARAARSLGYKVTIVGPSEPKQLVEAAADEGFPRIVLPAKNRAQYMLPCALGTPTIRMFCSGVMGWSLRPLLVVVRTASCICTSLLPVSTLSWYLSPGVMLWLLWSQAAMWRVPALAVRFLPTGSVAFLPSWITVWGSAESASASWGV